MEKKMIYIYRLLHIVLSPLTCVYLVVRLLTGKEDKARFKERLGVPSLDRDSSQKLIWVHCASVGESLSVLPMVKRLARTKDTKVLVTTGTVTSAALMAEKLPKNAFHQYIPIDTHFAVKRFMKHWQPDVSVFVESDLWPNLVSYSKNKILINARMSDRSYTRYNKIKPVAKMLLGGFDAIYAQSQQDYERFSKLTNSEVVNAGNLKYDGPAPAYKSQEFNVLSQAFQDRKVLVVSSTHKGEDAIFVEMYKKLKKHNDNLLMILFPRHPHRGDEIAQIIDESGLQYVQRSKTKGLEKASSMDVYLADTLGEVGLWYALADVVVIGGSFNWKGQNPLEALKAGKPVYTGPNMQNFKDMTDFLTAEGVMFTNKDEVDLTDAVNNAFNDDKFLKTFNKKAQTAVDKMTGATELLITAIRDKLKEVK
jgi:3-deoxy-D-manno-octulosonic-acid transferase